MVNWSLIGRATARYTIGYAGVASAVALGVTQSESVMLLVMLLGLGCIAWTLNSGTTAPTSIRDSNPTDGEVMYRDYDPTEAPGPAHRPVTLRFLFVGIGLLVFGAIGLVVVPML